MIQTSGVRVSPLRVAGNGASDPVTALGASPSRRPLAIPAPHLLSAPWECVTNIRRVPHLELATARAPFLRASVQVSLRLASPCPLPPAGTASLRNPRTLTRWLVGCWLRVCRPLFGGWFSLVHLGQGCQGPKCREALNPSRAGVEEAASRAGEAPGDGSSPSSAREGSSDPTLGPSEQCGSHAPRDTGLQLLARADASQDQCGQCLRGAEGWERSPQACHSSSLRLGSLRTPVLGALCPLPTQPPPLLRSPPSEAQQGPPLLA